MNKSVIVARVARRMGHGGRHTGHGPEDAGGYDRD